jgi:predicted DNA-binding protein
MSKTLKTASITILVEPETKALLTDLAKNDRRPLSAYINNIIEDFLDKAVFFEPHSENFYQEDFGEDHE